MVDSLKHVLFCRLCFISFSLFYFVFMGLFNGQFHYCNKCFCQLKEFIKSIFLLLMSIFTLFLCAKMTLPSLMERIIRIQKQWSPYSLRIQTMHQCSMLTLDYGGLVMQKRYFFSHSFIDTDKNHWCLVAISVPSIRIIKVSGLGLRLL